MAQQQEIIGFQMREGSNATHTSRRLMDEKQQALDVSAQRDSTEIQTSLFHQL